MVLNLFVCFLGFQNLVDTEVDTGLLLCLAIITPFAEVPGGHGLYNIEYIRGQTG